MGSIPKSDKELKLLELCEQYLPTMGLRAVEVDCLVSGRSLVRLYVEHLETGEGASLDECAEVSRLLGPMIDHAELIPGRYDLEVSSPGLDRRLRTTEDFAKNVGQEVRFVLSESLPSVGSKPLGRLVGVSDEGVTASVSGREVQIPLQVVKRANRVWAFEKPRKP